MTPFLPPNMTPEQAAELLRRAPPPAAPVPLSARQDMGLPAGGGPRAPIGPSASDVYGDTPRPAGRPTPQIMPMDNESMAMALMMSPPGMRAAGAIARPALEVGKRLMTASPLATGAATAAGAAALPSATGQTPWETMQGQWNQRRAGLQERIAAEQAAIAEAEKAAMGSRPKAPAATSNVNRGANALALYEQAMKQHQAGLASQTDPRRATITDLQGQLAQIDDETRQAQTPIREKYPTLGALAPPIAWAASALSGGKIGKFARGLQENRAAGLQAAADRGSTELARGRSAFTGPQGRATAAELQAAEGKGVAPLLTPTAAALTGGAVGALEGTLAPLGLTAIDAISAPGGSPLGMAAANAPYTPEFWMQAAPEAGVAAGTGALGAMIGALKKPGTGLMGIGAKFGPPSVPKDHIKGMSTAARQTPPPKPKEKPKADDN